MQAAKEAEAASLVQDAVRGAIVMEAEEAVAAATSMQAVQRGKAARAEVQAVKEAEAASLVQDAVRGAISVEAEEAAA
eukprot:2889206-Prymnesium_polylepis.1